ncbi:MAG: 50S ribosomal protein L17 [Verrucomicrobiaceae bacterium]|nr:50S ribosomal protein L17 [Verrucomicrobiaceae bacterium]
MKHRRKIVKLQRKGDHRDALLANLACSLIVHRRIRTTLAKAKALRPVAEKLVTLGKRALAATEAKDALHCRRQAIAKLRKPAIVKTLIDEIAKASVERKGGYTRITKLGQRRSDSAPMAFIEWVDAFVPKTTAAPAAEESAEGAAAPVEAEVVEAAAAPKKRATRKKKTEEA